ncbi:hypothetical protein [Bradyrhizobium yuanmingense]|uniref:hypothetical protein n=1 Tax=Bradyrhizobium yuanmingense TaxID=108015 RepID=UPI0023B94353|nr:hypothetical protein [Bradyrhizobium yuanmingense]MDF0585074.1 hypothetical protein [Bradyrhizobium yuanmingense]
MAETSCGLRALHSEVIDPVAAVHRGRVIKQTGDGAILQVRSAVDAVQSNGTAGLRPRSTL